MLNIMKKLVGFLTISSIWLLPVILPEIQAQQTTTPSSKAAPSPAITIEELKSRRAAIESMTDIDATVKTDSLKYIDRAITHIELAFSTNKRANELSQLIQTAPERLKILQAELKKPFLAPEKVEKRAQQMSTLKLEQRVRQKEAELAAAQSRLREGSDRLTAEKNIISQTPEQLATAISRLDDIQTELETISGAAETDILNHSKLLSLKSEREKLDAEIKLNELRQRSHNLLVELFSTERDVAQKAVESREQMLKSWQAEVQKSRQQEAAQAVEEAQDAIVETPLLPKIVQEQFDINIQLSTELEEITREETLLAEKYEGYQSRLKTLEEEFETAKKRVESAVLTEAIGLALRTQRLNLPAADQYFADSDARKIRMSEISEKQIALDRLLRELSDPKALADRLIGSLSNLSDVERKSLDLKIQELVANRREIIQKLKSGYNRIFKLKQDMEFTEQKLVTTAEGFAELLDRHLLWIRSSKRLSTSDLQHLRVSIGWFFTSKSWNQLFQDLSRSFRQNGVSWLIGLMIALILVSVRRWQRRKLKDIAKRVQQQMKDSFYLTLNALGLNMLQAVTWPFIMAFPSLLLLNLRSAQLFTTATASGMIATAQVLLFLNFAYYICQKNGLAQIHFQWAESSLQTLRRNLSWIIAISAASNFFLVAMETVPEIQYSDALAKFALIIHAAAIAVFSARILRFKGGITTVWVRKYPKSWLVRLRYIWYLLAVALPLFILFLAVQGYYYTALEIRHLIRLTVMLVFGLIVFNDLVLKLLMLARRKIALEKAMLAQQKQTIPDRDSGSASAATKDDQSSLMKSVIDMSAIDEQTRTLLKTVIFILALSGMWVIWEPVFPAFGILQDVELWSYTRVVNGTTQTVPITLADIAISVIVVAITIIAVRNLPGLLEMILLNRLPMDPGARYAYATICKYTLTALGIVIALNALGLRWSNLQWLIAALSVGLGFGLQEIVANFICGLIVLFERPFRLGDTVTVGEVHGTVTQIRIRATTIMDWDHKELIVPNKEFITGRLINWSLTENIIRFKIPVGIAYGSDTDLAEQLLLKVAKTNPLVLKSPEPQAVFLRFGDNALNFEVRVYIKSIDDWIPMLHAMNRAIDKEFRQAGITIAFPQRDVHLDATGPLEVRVVSEPSGSETGKRSSAAKKEPG